ncbi:unnamed protein product, partial [Owenia fusiformis]
SIITSTKRLCTWAFVFMVIHTTISEKCNNGQDKHPTATCSKDLRIQCPNTYKCKSQQCCKMDAVECDSLNDPEGIPYPCRGPAKRTCPDGYRCVVHPKYWWSVCCKETVCKDQDNKVHVDEDGQWLNPKDMCNRCFCNSTGGFRCTDMPRCRKCTVGSVNGKDKKLRQGKACWTTDGCTHCECIKGNVVNCTGPCQTGQKESTEFSPCPTSEVSGIQMKRVRLHKCISRAKTNGKVGERGEWCPSGGVKLGRRDETFNGGEVDAPCIDLIPEVDACQSNEVKMGKRKFSETRRHFIVGGNETLPYNWRWIAQLSDVDGRHHCGGSIISPKHILTAAHCICEFNKGLCPCRGGGPVDCTFNLSVALHNISNIDPSRTQFRTIHTENITIHPNYSIGSTGGPVDDLAILVVDPPLEFNDDTQPVKLPENVDDLALRVENEECQVIGWGNTHGSIHANTFSDVLKEANLEVRKFCPKRLGSRSDTVITDTMFCASKERTDSCPGDSGGPLMCLRQGVWTQYGIVSKASGETEITENNRQITVRCGAAKFPGVYTNVGPFLDWIYSTMEQDNVWSEYSPYTNCSVQCGVGMRYRTRVCISMLPPYRLGECPYNNANNENETLVEFVMKDGHQFEIESSVCNTNKC